jgi:hypothetical protein
METTKQNVILNYQSVLDEIKGEDIKMFVMNCLNAASDNFKNDEKICEHVKKTCKLLNQMLAMENPNGEKAIATKDLIMTSVILSDITINDLPKELKYLHPLTVRNFLDKFKGDMNSGLVEVLLMTIEGHEGVNSPSKLIAPKPGTIEYTVALAHQISRLECVEII